MFKLFRKYNKQILAVGGTLLMIIFMIGPATSLLMPSMDSTIGTYKDGPSLKGEQQRQYGAQLFVLENISNASAMEAEPIRVLIAEGNHKEVRELGNSLAQGFLQEAASILDTWGSEAQAGDTKKLKEQVLPVFKTSIEKFESEEKSVAQEKMEAIVEKLESGSNLEIKNALNDFSRTLTYALNRRQILIQDLSLAGLLRGNKSTAWAMIQYEAEELNGFDVSPGFAASQARLLMISDSYIQEQGQGVDLPLVYEALMSYQRFQKLSTMLVGFSGRSMIEHAQFVQYNEQMFRSFTSIPELRYSIWDRNTIATVKMTKVDITQDMLAGVGEPSEAEIVAHFEKYKDIQADPSNPGDFGYQLPKMYSYSTLEFTLAPLMSKVEVTEMDAIAYFESNVSQYYSENVDDLRREFNRIHNDPTTNVPTTQPAADNTTTQPATSSTGDNGAGDGESNTLTTPETTVTTTTDTPVTADQPDMETSTVIENTPTFIAPPMPETKEEFIALYRATRDSVFNDVRRNKALELQDEIVRWAENYIRTNDKILAQGKAEDGYFQVPEGMEKRIDFHELALAVQQEFDVLFTVTNYPLRPIEALDNAPVLGDSTVNVIMPDGSQKAVDLSIYVESVKELRGETSDELIERYRTLARNGSVPMLRLIGSPAFSDPYSIVSRILSNPQILQNDMFGFMLQRASPVEFQRDYIGTIIRTAVTTVGFQSQIAAQLIEALASYDNDDLEDNINQWGVQVGMVGRRAYDPGSSTAILWRIDGVQTPQAREDWQPIRETLILDFRKAKAFEMLSSPEEIKYYRTIGRTSLDDLKEQTDFPVRDVDLAPILEDFSVTGFGEIPEVVKEVFTNIEKQNIKGEAEIKQLNINALDREKLVTVTPDKGKLTLYITRLENFQPVTRESFIATRAQAMNRLNMADPLTLRELFSDEALMRRTGFELNEDDDDGFTPTAPQMGPLGL